METHIEIKKKQRMTNMYVHAANIILIIIII